MFTIFDEIIKKTTLKEWLGWDDENYRTTKSMNRERLFSWLSDDDEEDENGNKKTTNAKIITRGDDILELAKIITDENAIEKMETSRSLNADKFANAIEIIDNELTTAFRFINYADNETRELLVKVQDKFKGLLVAKGFTDLLENQNIQRVILYNTHNSQFTRINFESYKSLTNISLQNINRINVIAGENNSGKSTLLEGIYLLCKQNDIHAFFDILRRRGKFYNELPSIWINKEFVSDIKISGIFAGQETMVELIKTTADDETFDKSQYLSTVYVTSKFENERLESKAHLFEHKSSQYYFKKIKNLCNTCLSSPFSILSKSDLYDSHQKSVESKSIDKIIQFISTHVDNQSKKIELTAVKDLVRFLVSHDKFERAVDITQFGDGLQRIFQIALLFASSKNGVLLIDEFENAIHYTLLKRFANFIFELAELFNVQVFITSHSKECINAFFDESLDLEKISGYHLSVADNQLVINYEQGKYFSTLIKNFDAELR